jgi:DNA-binding helix-hairpin-helix protein with protein kinase domain
MGTVVPPLHCPVCNASFTHRQSLHKHRKNNACKSHGDSENPDKITSRTSSLAKYKDEQKENHDLKLEVEFLRRQIAEILEHPSSRPIQYAHTINNTTNTTVVINSFGGEDVSHIADAVFQELLARRNLFESLQDVTKMVHFDPETPQNMNVYLAKGQAHGFVWSSPAGTTTLEPAWLKKDADALVDEVMSNSMEKIASRLQDTPTNLSRLDALKTSIGVLTAPKIDMKALLVDNAHLVVDRGRFVRPQT